MFGKPEQTFKLPLKRCHQLKWPCARNTGRSGSGKNKKILIFPAGLEVHLEEVFLNQKYNIQQKKIRKIFFLKKLK